MIKGCHKSIVFLKDTGSELFEEAYFVIKPNVKKSASHDIIIEATNLVNSYKDKSHRTSKGWKLLFFSAGAVLGFSIMLFIHFLI